MTGVAGAGGGGTSRREGWWLIGLALLVMLPGLGLRDPWPADEPRYALIARDMVASGHWLFPHVGGELYADKPPVFFWCIAVLLKAGLPLRVAFLLPSLLAGVGSVLLVYDLGRRLWGREAGLAAACLLAVSVQLVAQSRVAQIDMLLTFLTTASLYGLGRHLLAGPDWRAYAAGGLAAGLGVITKGTGFLPLLLLLPFFALRRAGYRGLWMGAGGGRWWLAPVMALAGIALWLVPMLVAVGLSGDPAHAAYRDEILFRQTVTRYASFTGHQGPWYFFIVEVVPLFWLPGTLLLPWLVPRWRRAWQERDGRVWLLLAWIALVLVFFSFSSGKRGIYILPALPAFALATGPWLGELLARRRVQAVLFALSAAVGGLAAGAAAYLGLVRPALLARLGQEVGLQSVAPLACLAVVVAAWLVWFRPGRGAMAWVATVVSLVAVQGLWLAPMLNGSRSGRDFVADVEAAVPRGTELGLVGYKEQYLLYLTRPVTDFGHRRARAAGDPEARDAAYWLDAAPGRVLLVDGSRLEPCFAHSPARPVGRANGLAWFLVSPPAEAECVRQGNPRAAIIYRPPAS